MKNRAEYEEEPQSSEDVEYDKQEDVKDILEEMAAIEAKRRRQEKTEKKEKESEKRNRKKSRRSHVAGGLISRAVRKSKQRRFMRTSRKLPQNSWRQNL